MWPFESKKLEAMEKPKDGKGLEICHFKKRCKELEKAIVQEIQFTNWVIGFARGFGAADKADFIKKLDFETEGLLATRNRIYKSDIDIEDSCVHESNKKESDGA